ncbi:MAG: DUF928 domain-containing protein [Rhodopila sp.]|jgi:hypothetical protein
MATGLLVCPHAGRAAADNEQPADTTAKHDAGVQAAPGIQMLYIPPDRGAPEVRVSGGTRGSSTDGLRIDVLSPDQTGLTIQEQPTLYWYSSAPIRGGARVSIVADATSKTVMDDPIPGPVPAGIHAIGLRGTAVRLALNADYQWSVTAEMSATEPSRNIVTSGMIRRVAPPSATFGTNLRASAEGCAEYARAGLWYDALDAISASIQRSPQEGRLVLLRSELLQQVGLTNAAAADRSGVH